MPIVNFNGSVDTLTPVGVSNLGTIVFDNVVFPANAELLYNEVKLDSVSLVINRMKEIKRTPVSGRNGKFKEYISMDDFNIELNAIIAPSSFSILQLAAIAPSRFVPLNSFVSSQSGYTVPNEDIELLRNIKLLDDVPEGVAIKSKFLNNVYNITRVLIENCQVSKVTADTYAVKMTLIDDEPFDLKDFG